MATVAVSFTPVPAHVRTARFIAASVARRAGVAENVLDEVRLAVSEACSLAVRRHRAHAPDVPVELRLVDEDFAFRVEVADAVARPRFGEGAGEAGQADDDPLAALANAGVHLGEGYPGDGDLVEGYPGDRDPGNDDPEDDDPEDDDGPLADIRAREQIGLAVIDGLVDDFTVEYGDGGSVVTMRWPISDNVPSPHANINLS